jgi:hypothetical protein
MGICPKGPKTKAPGPASLKAMFRCFMTGLLSHTAFLLATLSASLNAGAAASNRLQSGVLAAAPAPVQIVWQAASGQPEASRSGQRGSRLFLNDQLITGPAGGARILLLDASTLTLGPDSHLRLDKFIYDPAAATENTLLVRIRSGRFKYSSGEIAGSGGTVRLILPNAVAAVRGTQLAGQLAPDGTARLLLLSGAVAVTSQQGAPVWLSRSGWGLSISQSGQISQPSRFAEAEQEALLSGFVPASKPANNRANNPVNNRAQIAEQLANQLIAQLAPDAGGQFSSAAIASWLADQGLTGKTGLRPQDLQGPANQQNLIAEGLLAYALSGGRPFWASILPAGGVGNIEPAAPQPGALPSLDRQLWQTRYGDRISPAYQGSARFSSTGFALSRGLVHAGDTVLRSSQTGSGEGFFDLVLDYDAGRISGRFGWRDLQLNGVGIADTAGQLDNPAGTAGAQILDSEIGTLATGQPPLAGAKLFASVGSISDGTHLLDGQLGGFEMRVFDSQNQELARDSQGNLLDRNGTITGDASQALSIPALSATVWTKAE